MSTTKEIKVRGAKNKLKNALYRAFYNGNALAVLPKDIDMTFQRWYEGNIDWITKLEQSMQEK